MYIKPREHYIYCQILMFKTYKRIKKKKKRIQNISACFNIDLRILSSIRLGYTPVTIKLPAEHTTQISDRKIKSIRNNLMHLIDAKFDDIVFRGITEGCVLIHTEMRPPLLPRIKRLGIFSAFIFQKYEISDIYSENKCLYSNTKVLSAYDKDLMDPKKYSVSMFLKLQYI